MQFYLAYIWDEWSEWRIIVGVFSSIEKADEMTRIVIKNAINDYKNSPFGVGTEGTGYDGIDERFNYDIMPIDVDKLYPDDLCAILS